MIRSFRKTQRRFPDMLACEKEGLEALAAVGKVAVAKVLGYGKTDGEEWLEIELLEHPTGKLNYYEFGRRFAEHHLVPVGTDFGWKRNNYIGNNVQINTPSADWWEFYATRRLEFQTKMARDAGLIDTELAKQLSQIAQHLSDRWSGLKIWPSLLHGDLWAGNHLMRPDGEGVLIDPAVYQGHWEADLAMTKLFGGYPLAFYQGYHSIIPKEREHESRETLYNLYHVLNHLNLFGRSYLAQVRNMARSLV